VNGRSTHLIVAYNPDNVRSWFYFDKETFLPIRWGGISKVANVEEYADYRAIRFEAIADVMLPKAIDLLLENDVYGEIKFTSIEANVDIDESIFEMPEYESPVLRQKTETRTTVDTAPSE